MPISKELMLAILSMDSYNRGYGAGIEGLGGPGSQIGTATMLNKTIPAGSEEAGFYAAAYTLNSVVGDMAAGTTAISYRGTDNPDALGLESGASDLWMADSGCFSATGITRFTAIFSAPPARRPALPAGPGLPCRTMFTSFWCPATPMGCAQHLHRCIASTPVSSMPAESAAAISGRAALAPW